MCIIVVYISILPRSSLVDLMFLDWNVCGDWSSDACPVCGTFPISEARTSVPFSDIGEVLSAHLHRTCLVICPHPHCEWGIQT